MFLSKSFLRDPHGTFSGKKSHSVWNLVLKNGWTPRYLPERNENSCRHRNVHSSITPNSQSRNNPDVHQMKTGFKKMQSLSILEYHPVIKWNEVLGQTTAWMNLKSMMLRESSQTQEPHIAGFHSQEMCPVCFFPRGCSFGPCASLRCLSPSLNWKGWHVCCNLFCIPVSSTAYVYVTYWFSYCKSTNEWLLPAWLQWAHSLGQETLIQRNCHTVNRLKHNIEQSARRAQSVTRTLLEGRPGTANTQKEKGYSSSKDSTENEPEFD